MYGLEQLSWLQVRLFCVECGDSWSLISTSQCLKHQEKLKNEKTLSQPYGQKLQQFNNHLDPKTVSYSKKDACKIIESI
jgi:hypothetical protein